MVRAPCGIINNIESKYLCSNLTFSPDPVRKKIRLQGVISNLRCFYIDQGAVKSAQIQKYKAKNGDLKFCDKKWKHTNGHTSKRVSSIIFKPKAQKFHTKFISECTLFVVLYL